jgi:hypothetical protein
VGFVLASGGTFEIWVFRHGLRPDAGARFKSDQKLQTAALEILEELIRKELLTVSVLITDPAASLSCRAREAIVAGSREPLNRRGDQDEVKAGDRIIAQSEVQIAIMYAP